MGRALIYVIFALCAAMTLLLLLILLAEPVAGAGGVAHPVFEGMRRGGDGAARLQHIGAYAYAFQALLLALIVALSTLGISERHRSARLRGYMISTFLFSAFILWRMVASHQQFLATGETTYFMGFPAATAWAIYGVWAGAVPLMIIYVAGFRQYIYTEDDEAQFNALLEETRAQDTQEGAR
jgi:hypothetical protein